MPRGNTERTVQPYWKSAVSNWVIGAQLTVPVLYLLIVQDISSARSR